MRAGIGLVGILVTIGVIALLIGKGGWFDSATSSPVKQAREQAKQVSGIEWPGSIDLATETQSGKIVAITVNRVTPGSPADTYYGLKEADAIVEIGQLGPVKGQITSDKDADAFVMDAYQRQQTLVVMRDGNRITLPQAKPKTPSGNTGNRDALQQQIDTIGTRRGL